MNEPAILKVYNEMDNKYDDLADFFLNDIDRILADDYIPSDQDIVLLNIY